MTFLIPNKATDEYGRGTTVWHFPQEALNSSENYLTSEFRQSHRRLGSESDILQTNINYSF